MPRIFTELEARLLAALKEVAPERPPVDSYWMQCQVCFAHCDTYTPTTEQHESNCAWVVARKLIAELEET